MKFLSEFIPAILFLLFCYLALDKWFFRGELFGLFKAGWKPLWKDLVRKVVPARRAADIIPPPADYRTVLLQKDFEPVAKPAAPAAAPEGGHGGTAADTSAETAQTAPQSDTFAAGTVAAAAPPPGQIPPDRLPELFGQEVEVDPGDLEMEWADEDDDEDHDYRGGTPPEEDYDPDAGLLYDEFEALMGHVTGRELSPKEAEMARRCATNLQGSVVLEQIIEGRITEAGPRIRELLNRTVVHQDDPLPDDAPPAGDAPAGFRLEDYK